MTRYPGRVFGTILTLVLLGCETPGASPTRPSVRWEMERLETQQAPVPAEGLDTTGRQIVASSDPHPPTPVAVPSARPTGGFGGAAAPAGPPRGRVFAYGNQGLTTRPLEGATVWTSDGRTATTAADGRFTLTGAWPADGTWVVHHPSYHASTVVGLTPEGEVEFHLKTNTVVPGPARPSNDNAFQVSGRVVDGDGNPVEAVTILMNAKDGSFGTPGFTAADGTFSMKVLAHGDTVEDAAFVAVDYDTEAWMGLASDVTISKADPQVDFNRSAPGRDDFEIAPTTHSLRLNVTSAPADLRVRSYVDLLVPGLEPIPVFGHEDTMRLADLSGARYNVRVYAADSERTRLSAFVRERLLIDFRNPETTLDIALLTPPVVHPVPVGPLSAISWDPVAGVSGYEVRLDSEAARGFQWEAFTQATMLAFNVPGGTPSGRYTMKVSAWEANGMTPRRIASTGRSELRVLPHADSYRVSTTESRLEF